MAESYCKRLTLLNINGTNGGELLLTANSPKY